MINLEINSEVDWEVVGDSLLTFGVMTWAPSSVGSYNSSGEES